MSLRFSCTPVILREWSLEEWVKLSVKKTEISIEKGQVDDTLYSGFSRHCVHFSG